MIKINLASRKQVAMDGAPQSQRSLEAMFHQLLGRADLAQFSEILPVRKLLASIAIGFLASYGLSDYKDRELARMDAEIAQLEEEKAKLTKGLEKIKDYEAIKKQLETDGEAIKKKLDIIKKLLVSRDDILKAFLSISGTLPKEVWFTDFSFAKDEVLIKGSSLGYGQISDFMKNLSETSFFENVELKNTESLKDQAHKDETAFEVTAKRRVNP